MDSSKSTVDSAPNSLINSADIQSLELRLEALLLRRNDLDAKISSTQAELAAAKEALEKTATEASNEQVSIFEFDLLCLRPKVNRQSPIAEKYNLFCELFSGRPDVHAHRFENPEKGTCGYVPACANEQNWNICKRGASGKQKVRCVDCEHQAFYAITQDVFVSHITGGAKNNTDVLGAYPMDTYCMCKFIVADFDMVGRKAKAVEATAGSKQAASMRQAALAFCKVCWDSATPVYMERSRSGNGIHVWLFFTELVEARLARRLMTALLTKAMSESKQINFESYDMLIPRQDTISKFGFGNLVALPLQGKAGKPDTGEKDKNSLFVNESFLHYPDQWEFLSSIRKLTPSELDKLIARLASAGELGDLVCNDDDEDALTKPWEKRKPKPSISADDFACHTNEPLEIVRANMLYLPKRMLSARAANKIRRLAAFRNPDFYKSQAMRLETWGKPRVICAAEETQEYLSIPRGCEAALVALLEAAQASYTMIDKTEAGRPLSIAFNGKLRAEQMSAAAGILAHNTGVLSAPTGFGKTVIGAYLIAKRSVNALVLVPNTQLFEQWCGALNRFLSIEEEPQVQLTRTGRKRNVEKVGRFSGKKKLTSGLVDVAMIQSLRSNKTGDIPDFIKDYGLVLVDECQHVPASSFEPVLKHINARYVYGLTATPFRDDGHHAIIFLECGPIRVKIDACEQAQKRPFEHYLVPRFTKFMPSSIHDENNFAQILGDLGCDSKRNQMIVCDVTGAIKAGRKPLVLTERTEHVAELSRLLSADCDNVITLIGAMCVKAKEAANERLALLCPEDCFVVIATGKYAGEGFDFPMLDTLFITMPIAFRGRVAQYTGRLHRLVEGKGDVYVYDYVDVNIPMLEKMYHKRLRGYRDVGYKAVATKQDTAATDTIFSRANYWANLEADIRQAKAELVISAPKLVAYQVTRILQALAAPMLGGAVATVITPSFSTYKESAQKAATICIERLKSAGVKVVEKHSVHQRFVIIDKEIIWYGSINPLGNVAAADSMLRFSDAEVAEQLLADAFG